jgi:hypothetical protein
MRRSRRQSFTVMTLDVYLWLLVIAALFVMGAAVVQLITALHDARLYSDGWRSSRPQIWVIGISGVFGSAFGAVVLAIPVLVVRDVLDHLAMGNKQLEDVRAATEWVGVAVSRPSSDLLTEKS